MTTDSVTYSNQGTMWRKSDTTWTLGLFGTAIGAGVLFFPIRAGFGGLIPILIMLVLAVILYVDMRIVKQMGQPLGQIMNIIFLAFSVLYVMVFLYIYPVLAKFYNSTRNTFINAVLMSVRHLPYTVLMAAVCACPIILVSFAPTFRMQATIALICLVIGGAVVAYCNSFFLDKIFQNYIPEDAENPDGGKAE